MIDDQVVQGLWPTTLCASCTDIDTMNEPGGAITYGIKDPETGEVEFTVTLPLCGSCWDERATVGKERIDEQIRAQLAKAWAKMRIVVSSELAPMNVEGPPALDYFEVSIIEEIEYGQAS